MTFFFFLPKMDAEPLHGGGLPTVCTGVPKGEVHCCERGLFVFQVKTIKGAKQRGLYSEMFWCRSEASLGGCVCFTPIVLS